MRIVTACNEIYYERMVGWLDSLAARCNVPYTLVKVGWDAPSGRNIDEVTLGRDRNYGAPNQTESVQHGSFLQVIDGPEDDLLIYCDGDMVMQRAFWDSEMEWLDSFGNDTASAGWNQPDETLEDCVGLIQGLAPMDEIYRRFPGELNEWPSLNVGVLAMRRPAWQRVYAAYLERWELAGKTFGHQARQQWLVCYVIFALGLDFRLMPYSLHSHGHFGLKPGIEQHGEEVVVGGKLAAIRHHIYV
jgi:hypothetical protein